MTIDTIKNSDSYDEHIAELVFDFVALMLDHDLTPLQIINEVTTCLQAITDDESEDEDE